jgi:hypothetical protein
MLIAYGMEVSKKEKVRLASANAFQDRGVQLFPSDRVIERTRQPRHASKDMFADLY